MTTAHELITDLRQELAPLVDRVRGHAYVRALAEGQIPRDSLRLFAGEQYHIIRNDTRSFARLLSRQEDADLRRFFLDSVAYEAAAFDALLAFAAALGLAEPDLQAYEPLPGAHAYTAFLALTATHGSAAEMAAAFLVDLGAWGANCAAISRALQERYGLSREQVRFFDHFAAEDPQFEPRSLQVVQHGLDRGVFPRDIRRTARLMMSYELLYWDTVYEASCP